MNFYFYLTTEDTIIRIRHRAKPATYNVFQHCPTFVVYEFTGSTWQMAAFPEVTLGQLKKLHYLGWAPCPIFAT